MVEAQIKNQNTFWLWSEGVDFTKRGDVAYYQMLSKPVFTYAKKLKEIGTNVFELSDYIKGFAFRSSDYLKSGSVGIYRVTDISDRLNFDEIMKVDSSFWDKYRDFIIKPFDIIMTVTGNTVGKCFLIPETIPQLLMNQNAMIIRAKEKENSLILYAFFLTEYFNQKVEIQAHSGTRPFLDLNFFRDLFLPKFSKEQKEIVNKLIQKTLRLKTEAEQEYQEATTIFLENLKKSISEWDTLTTETKKAFWLWSDQVDITNRIDPDYYSGEGIRNKLGKIKPLAELAEIKIGKTPAFDDYLPSGKRRIMKFRAITGRGIDLENEERGFVKEEFFQKNKHNKLNDNDIVLGSAAHQAHYIGKYLDIVDELPKEFSDGVLTVAEIMTIRTREGLNPFVLLLFLRSGVGYELIQRQIKGQTSHLYPKDVRSIGIPESVVKISKSKVGAEIENKIKSSLEKALLSKWKLQEAKDFVENLIKNPKAN